MKSARTSMMAALLSIGLAGALSSANAAEFVGFNSDSTYSILGSVNATTEPTALRVLFDGPVLSDTFVSIITSDPSVVVVLGGGAVVASGQSSSFVLLSGLELGNAVVTAQFSGFQSMATVAVVTGIPAVPEPGTFGMLALGLALIPILRKRVP